MATDARKSEWDAYVASERARVEPLLREHGISLDEKQPQTIGERYLTRPVGGGRKVVFFGRQENGARVVIKTSSEANGVEELILERQSRAMLDRIRFAYHAFLTPKEILFDASRGMLITEYIEQERPFLERPLQEQFNIALEALKAQEGAHATTASHWSSLERLMKSNNYYIKPGEYQKIGMYAQDMVRLDRKNPFHQNLESVISDAVRQIQNGEKILEQYSGFLTHWDFIPQNFRVYNGKVFLLDHTSLRFGNKYESWARFINFMELYNPPLARALIEYVRLNRAPEEVESLRLMRVFRLVELIRYYVTWLDRTEGNQHLLTEKRIIFWTHMLRAVLDTQEISPELVEEYKKTRDALRSDEEKERQKGLH